MTTARRRLAGLAALLVLLLLAVLVRRFAGPDDVAPAAPAAPPRAALPEERKPTPRPPRRRRETPKSSEDAPQRPAAEPAPAAPFTVKVLRADGTPAAGAQVTMFELFHAPTRLVADGTGAVSFAPEADEVVLHAVLGDEAAVVRTDKARRYPEGVARLEPAVRIHVRVTEGGRPIPKALVDVPLGIWPADSDDQRAHARREDDGGFELPLLPKSSVEAPRRLHVEARAVGFPPVTAFLRAEDLRTGELVVELVRGFVVRGTVVGAAGEPLADVVVELVAGRPAAQTMTDASGRFELTLSRAGGEVAVVRTRDDAKTAKLLGTFDGKAGDVDVGVVRLREGGPLAGRVVDERGAPVVGAEVEVTLSRKTLFRGETDEAGRFEFPGASDEPHEIEVREPDRAVGRVALVHGVRGGDPERRILLSGASSVLVRFFDEAHAPKEVGRAHVTVGRKGERCAFDEWRTGDDDAFRAALDRQGRFDVEVDVPGFEPQTFTDVEVAADRETSLDVVLRRKATER